MMPERVEGELVNRIFPFIFFSLITEELAILSITIFTTRDGEFIIITRKVTYIDFLFAISDVSRYWIIYASYFLLRPITKDSYAITFSFLYLRQFNIFYIALSVFLIL